MDYELVDLIDINELKELTDNWTELIGLPMGIFDPYGNALLGSGWLSICTDFHRVNPDTLKRCHYTDQEMFNRLKDKNEKFCYFKCPNGLVDTGSAIIVDGEYVGGLGFGQFFLEPPVMDFFSKQADEFGFDKEKYLDAVAEVPILSLEYVRKVSEIWRKLAGIIAETGLKRMRLHELNYEMEKQQSKLFESEERYRAFMDNSPTLSYIKDQTLKHVYGNQTLLNEMDISIQDFIGTTSHDYFANDLAEHIEAYDKTVLTEKTILDIPAWSDEKHGEERWWKEIKFPIIDSSGETFVGGTVSNISALKNKEKALQISEERYRLLVETSPISIMVVRDGKFVFVNPSGARMLGASDPEELKGLPVMDIVAPESRKLVSTRIERLNKQESNPMAEIKLIRQDGIKITVESTSISALLEGESSAIIICQDITKRKEREKDLQMMKYSIDNALDRIAWIAKDGTFIYANNPACEEMAYTLKDVLKMKVSDIDPLFPQEKWEKHFENVKEQGFMRLETKQIDGKGQAHDIEVSANYLKFGDLEFMCSFGRDITDLRQKEHELKKAYEEIKTLKNQLEEENIFLIKEMKLLHSHDEIVGKSQAIKLVLSQAEQVADQDTSVLILGETGTGKELLAHAIHNMSPRKDRAMVIVNCASLPATLIEGELFGREKGAYTGALTKQAGRFEIADKSTIFLDEIGDLPLEMQAKLLRVLQEGKFERLGSTKNITVDVRVIAATNHDLKQDVADGKFRKDLFYRLSVFPVTVPPLTERRDDIPLLTWSFVKDLSKRMGKTVEKIPKKTMEMLQEYSWPGNVRELRNVIERAMILHRGSTLTVAMGGTEKIDAVKPASLQDVDRQHIRSILEQTHWKVSGRNGAAEILGLKESTLRARMKKLGIKRGS